MTYIKKIVCLANSQKNNGRCVAGLEITDSENKPWVRPVSSRVTQEISDKERCYKDGADPKLLDIISIGMIEPAPQGHQQENHLIDDRCRWEKKGVLTWNDLLKLIENPDGPLWKNGESSRNGINDHILETYLGNYNRSLYLIYPQNLLLLVSTFFLQRQVRAQFDLCGHHYCIVVTDPWIKERCFKMEDGDYPVGKAALCVSLGEVFQDGFAYKLAASVITPKRAGI